MLDRLKKRSGFIILILGALTTISPFSIDMYLPAFQQIAERFQTTIPIVSFSLSSYFIGLALGQIFYGPFLDRYGRRPPIFFGLTIYLVASIACLYATSIHALIIFRFFQAIGGCAAQVAAVAMVRDFFPPREGARVFSKLMLILSVSPLFAPTVGSIITTRFGWQAVFLSLAAIVLLVLLAVIFLLPEGHRPDPSISLNPRLILKEFVVIFKYPQFFAFAFAGAFSFAGLFTYVAGASSLFMGEFQLNAKVFGLIFALLSIGVIGGGQFNILLTYRFAGEKIFKNALSMQVIIALIYLFGSWMHWYGLYAQLFIFFAYLSCVGLTYPNAASLALAPFDKNAGSAAALLGFIQMGVGALASAAFGILGLAPSLTIGLIFFATASIGLLFFRLSNVTVVETPSESLHELMH
jgi:DHA1 family bicyclomycin/chloramphenicol resistance-like MFS transporter